jgi:hypothetical protein
MAAGEPTTRAPLTWSIFDGFHPPNRPPTAATPTWSVFDGFERPRPRPRASWAPIDELISRAGRFAAERCHELPELRRRWDERLADLGGDPSREDWTSFRLLRASREEDWSDWLQHFIATSRTGRFSQELFSHSGFTDGAPCVEPEVLREDVTEGRRADLVIRWADGQRSQLEVKVGDRAFEKTAETAGLLEAKYPATRWTHYILLPAEDREAWERLAHPQTPLIHVLTWDEVAVALRRSLRRQQERHLWLAWAHGFCGLIEQKLLGHPIGEGEETPFHLLERRTHQISLMKKGLEDV